jgi:transposase
MAHLSEKQRIEILMIYRYDGDRRRTQSELCDLFNEVYPDTPVAQGTVSQLIKKFRETGSIKNMQRTGRPKSATSGDKALDVLLTIEETPRVSAREVAENLEISHNSVLRIFKKEKIVIRFN